LPPLLLERGFGPLVLLIMDLVEISAHHGLLFLAARLAERTSMSILATRGMPTS
jgi:hypothetical protein